MEVLQSTDGIAWDHTDSSTTLNTFNSQLTRELTTIVTALFPLSLCLHSRCLNGSEIYLFAVECPFLVVSLVFDVETDTKPPLQLGLKLGENVR